MKMFLINSLTHASIKQEYMTGLPWVWESDFPRGDPHKNPVGMGWG